MQIRLCIPLAVSPSELFELLHNYTLRKKWDTFVPDATLLGAHEAGAGVIVRCVDGRGRSMDTVYTGFDRPTVATIKMLTGPWPFYRFGGSWRIVEEGPGYSRLFVNYHLVTRPACLRFVLERLVSAIFRHQTQKRLEALAGYIVKLNAEKVRAG
jgi:hypothetical protein